MTNKELIEAEKKMRIKHGLCPCIEKYLEYCKGGKKETFVPSKQKIRERQFNYNERIQKEFNEFSKNIIYMCDNKLCQKTVKGWQIDSFIEEWNEFFKKNK